MGDAKTTTLAQVTQQQGFTILGEINIQNLIAAAYAQFITDLQLLETAPLDSMINNFNQAIATNIIFYPELNKATYWQQLNTENSTTLATYQGKRVIEQLPDNPTDTFTKNLNSLIITIFAVMNNNGAKLQLTYHTPGHALETAQGAYILSELMEYPEWKILLFVCGLCHDAIFTRTRAQDEIASANFLITTLQPFLNTQAATRKYFEALIRVIIIGGTLPIFYLLQPENPNNKTHKPQTYQKTLIEFEALFGEKKPQSNNHKIISILAHIMSTADVQRSLIPKIILANNLKQPHETIDKNSILYTIVKRYFQDNNIAATTNLSINTFIDIVYIKFIQGVRFVAEYLPCGQTTLNPLQLAMTTYLRAPDTDEKTFINTITQNLSTFSETVAYECGFYTTAMESLKDQPPQKYEFYPESWGWQRDICTQLLQLEKTSPEIYQNIIMDLLRNAKLQQGLTMDPKVLINDLKGSKPYN